MAGGWKVELYENSRGEKPVEKFLDSLDKRTLLKIVRAFELLEEFGVEGGYTHIKKMIGTNVWEYRILGSDSIRLFYVTLTDKQILILHGFKKTTQKTPAKEIRIAQKRLLEYKSRKLKK